MKKQGISFGVAVCLLVSVLVCPCLSQRRSSRASRNVAQQQQQRQREFERRRERCIYGMDWGIGLGGAGRFRTRVAWVRRG